MYAVCIGTVNSLAVCTRSHSCPTILIWCDPVAYLGFAAQVGLHHTDVNVLV